MAPRKEDNSPHHQFYRKFRPGEMINSQAKQVILNVFFQISTLNPAKSWNKVALEAAMLTGVCSKTIFKLKSEKQATLYLDNPHPEPVAPVDENADDVGGATLGGEEGGPPAKPPTKKRKKGEKREKKEPRPPSPRSIKRKCTVRPKKRIERYDESVLTAIRLKMHEYLGRNEPPTVSKVLGDINMDEQLPNFSRSTFHRILKDMGLTTYLQTPHGPKKKVKPDPNGGPGGPGGGGGGVGQQGVGGQGGQVGQGVAGGSAGGGAGGGGGQMSQHHQSHANPATLPLNYGHPQIRDHHSLPMHNVSRMGFQ